ncbi:hypothetical protein B0I37DRAFT_22754 [Chaetomium sp. MPI-CAGE-AT-0009]|nr:hypothetical protein B0I37DRAFT_22754 [Chaetomium sp. MPI-CAGE-AT-0009]
MSGFSLPKVRGPHAAAGAVARLQLSRFRCRRSSFQSRAVGDDAPGAPGGWGTMHSRSSRPPCSLPRLVFFLSLQTSCWSAGSYSEEHATHGRSPPLPTATTPFYCRSQPRGTQSQVTTHAQWDYALQVPVRQPVALAASLRIIFDSSGRRGNKNQVSLLDPRAPATRLRWPSGVLLYDVRCAGISWLIFVTSA